MLFQFILNDKPKHDKNGKTGKKKKSKEERRKKKRTNENDTR